MQQNGATICNQLWMQWIRMVMSDVRLDSAKEEFLLFSAEMGKRGTNA